MFKVIKSFSDIVPFVSSKQEIRFFKHSNNITIGCYMFMDSKTFDTPEALECRGIAFDQNGKVVSRPLHKFFNMDEKESLTKDKLLLRQDIAAIYEKIDGSMIATAWIDNQLVLRSKKAFDSDVVNLANHYLAQAENQLVKEFATVVARSGLTAIFELTHPDARIVVAAEKPLLRLLHVRNNENGQYVLLDKNHEIHALIKKYQIQMVEQYSLSLVEVLNSLENMTQKEGYVVQFTNGDMVKIKCPWYLRLHRGITFLRERDIAMLSINEELDDVKGALTEAGIDLTAVNEVESRLKNILMNAWEQIENVYIKYKHLDRKNFALAHKDNPLFGMMIARYLGREVPLVDWYTKNRLKEDFSLRVLADNALADIVKGDN